MDKQDKKPEDVKVEEVKAEEVEVEETPLPPIPRHKMLTYPVQHGFSEPEEVRLVRLAHEAALKKQQEKNG